MPKNPTYSDLYVGDLSPDEQFLLYELNERVREIWLETGEVSDTISCMPILVRLLEEHFAEWEMDKKVNSSKRILDFLNDALELRDADMEVMQ